MTTDQMLILGGIVFVLMFGVIVLSVVWDL